MRWSLGGLHKIGTNAKAEVLLYSAGMENGNFRVKRERKKAVVGVGTAVDIANPGRLRPQLLPGFHEHNSKIVKFSAVT